MDMVLTGILDLVLMDTATMNPIVVDFKTARQAKSQSAADEDIQLSMYAYLMDRAGYTDLSHPLECRFHVLRKLKTPKLEAVTTFRTHAPYAPTGKTDAGGAGRDRTPGVYSLQSWLCSDCAYADACKGW